MDKVKFPKTVTVRMSEELKGALEARARKERRKTSVLIRLILEEALGLEPERE